MTTTLQQETIVLEEQGGIATLSFNRPEQMNCFNWKMGEELLEVTEHLSRRDDLKALCIKGNGRLFMAGGDIAFFHEHNAILDHVTRKFEHRFFVLVRRVDRDVCIGAGAEVAFVRET